MHFYTWNYIVSMKCFSVRLNKIRGIKNFFCDCNAVGGAMAEFRRFQFGSVMFDSFDCYMGLCSKIPGEKS